MKKKQKFEKKEGFKLSPRFERMYGLYIAGHLSLNKLKKEFQTVDDVMFYHRMAPDPSSLDLHLRTVLSNKFDAFILNFFEKFEILENKKELMRFFVKEIVETCASMEKREDVVDECKEISRILIDGKKENLSEDDIIIQNSMKGEFQNFKREMSHALLIAKDPLDLSKFFVRQLISIYAVLAVSDQEGVKKCRELGPFVSAYWGKEIPINITLSYLKHFHEKGNMNEMKLLERFSF